LHKHIRTSALVEDPDILALQKFLNTHGFTVSQSGPGSPGTIPVTADPPSCAPAWRHGQGQAPRVLRNLDPAGRGRTLGALAPKESHLPHQAMILLIVGFKLSQD
jgi:hypothetical protein